VSEPVAIASTQVVAAEDPLIEDPTSEPELVEDVHAIELAKKSSVDPQSIVTP
ncbi:hypothetical protein A2U01_0109509, partial [Trifolium medium]|nr:hypothetical protein [Trifolium medium]